TRHSAWALVPRSAGSGPRTRIRSSRPRAVWPNRAARTSSGTGTSAGSCWESGAGSADRRPAGNGWAAAGATPRTSSATPAAAAVPAGPNLDRCIEHSMHGSPASALMGRPALSSPGSDARRRAHAVEAGVDEAFPVPVPDAPEPALGDAERLVVGVRNLLDEP